MKKRSILEEGKDIRLCGESDGAQFTRTFTIVKKISEGASSICYEAYYSNSGRGVLKEFYPQEAYELERNDQGQLVSPAEFGDAHERFLKLEKKYIEPYEMMFNIKRNSNNHDLETFIPAFEIYHGCVTSDNAAGTVYVWTPDPRLETFDRICEEIHKDPHKNPERKLITVLTALETLTKCICALHKEELIHRDIKPSNFGFVKRGNETLTQTLSMFDIDSVCPVLGERDGVVGTPGYLEPEAGSKKADNQTDIYAIGATLFHAIIVPEKAAEDGYKYLYQPQYYKKLRRMVNESELIQVSEANAHPRLTNILTVILQKSLCERDDRYANCEELLVDIETALYYALPSDIARKNRSGEKWELAEVLKSFETNREKNSLLAIQHHLYQHPLYECAADDMLNVLMIGCGHYGQKFLDACLQAGQIRGKKLKVTVISDEGSDKDIYLNNRPELSKFFHITIIYDEEKEIEISGKEDIYGDITFRIAELERGNPDENFTKMQDIMTEYHNDEENGAGAIFPHYIFVALGEDELNLKAARACKEAADALDKNCLVSYACEETMASREESPASNDMPLYPVLVNADVKKSALYPEIERMAFNTHLVWEKNLNVDYKSIKADFRKNYNYNACVAYVVSLKYKLHSIGIELEENGFNEAAEKFDAILSDSKKNQDVINELIWVEHRRWVTEKLCSGWRGIPNLEDCAGGMTKDARNKRHVCILHSRPDQKLTTDYRTNYYKKWDTASERDLEQLDELDRMSVEMHRMFMAKAGETRKQNLLYGDNMAAIRTLIEGDKKSFVAFQEWFACLKGVWNQDIEKVRLYKGLKASFLSASDGLSYEKQKAVREQVRAFETVFYPVLASMEYRDWKQDDVALIDAIPFVLTYTENAYMVIPYTTGNPTEVFRNVAAPTIVSPARILYLYYIKEEQDKKKLHQSLPYVMSYMQKKKFKAAVEMILLYTDKTADIISEDFVSQIRESGNGRIRQVITIQSKQVKDMAVDLKNYLERRRSGKRVFAVEENETSLSGILQGADFYSVFSAYRFDLNSMQFESLGMPGCDMLRFIKKKTYITVADIAAFRLSSSESSNQPEFFEDYSDLWKKYHYDINSSNAWKALCKVLKGYAEENDVLVSFKKGNLRGDEEAQEYQYIVPFACKKSIEKIVSFLKEQKMLEEESSVNGYTTDSCKVTIVDKCGYRKAFDQLFARVYALLVPDAVTLAPFDHAAKVMFDDLTVSGVSLENSLAGINKSKYQAAVEGLLKYFSEKGYLIHYNVNETDGKISFTYATRQIKELLTTEGKMLEVYTYHKAREIGKFDDVVSGYEINWAGTAVKNEFDCILTKGFRTLFVECKAQDKIDQTFYAKLLSFAGQFGINASYVLIADTQEQPEYASAVVNDMQRERGNMMDIVTIWKKDEINNIGHTLLKIINGKYESKRE